MDRVRWSIRSCTPCGCSRKVSMEDPITHRREAGTIHLEPAPLWRRYLVWEKTGAIRVLGTVIALALFGGLLYSACSNNQVVANIQALRTYTVGPPGHQIRISASPSQRPRTTPSPLTANGVVPGATNYMTSLSLPRGGKMQVSIIVSPSPIPQALASRIIDSYFNNTPQKLVTWHGVPADIGVVPCSTPSGSCPGFVGGFTVVLGTALYNVFIPQAGNDSMGWAVINSIAIT